jgi:hypothetical protein
MRRNDTVWMLLTLCATCGAARGDTIWVAGTVRDETGRAAQNVTVAVYLGIARGSELGRDRTNQHGTYSIVAQSTAPGPLIAVGVACLEPRSRVLRVALENDNRGLRRGKPEPLMVLTTQIGWLTKEQVIRQCAAIQEIEGLKMRAGTQDAGAARKNVERDSLAVLARYPAAQNPKEVASLAQAATGAVDRELAGQPALDAGELARLAQRPEFERVRAETASAYRAFAEFVKGKGKYQPAYLDLAKSLQWQTKPVLMSGSPAPGEGMEDLWDHYLARSRIGDFPEIVKVVWSPRGKSSAPLCGIVSGARPSPHEWTALMRVGPQVEQFVAYEKLLATPEVPAEAKNLIRELHKASQPVIVSMPEPPRVPGKPSR